MDYTTIPVRPDRPLTDELFAHAARIERRLAEALELIEQLQAERQELAALAERARQAGLAFNEPRAAAG
jgi:hypothetical protein